jgi:hypothetical protein
MFPFALQFNHIQTKTVQKKSTDWKILLAAAEKNAPAAGRESAPFGDKSGTVSGRTV